MCYSLTLECFLYCFTFVFEPCQPLQDDLNSGTSVKASKTKLERLSPFTVNIVTTDCCFLQMEIEPSHKGYAEQPPSISIMEERILGLLRSGKTACYEGLHPEFVTGTHEGKTLKCSLNFCTHRLHPCPCMYTSIFIYTMQSYTYTHM